MRYQITEAYNREFEVAPYAAKGEAVRFEKVDPKNHRWFFGTDSRGVAGFFPVDWFQLSGDRAVALRDYNSSELSVCVGASVSVLDQYGGWILVEDASARRGWIPESSIK